MDLEEPIMNQDQRLDYLIRALQDERKRWELPELPGLYTDKRRLLRALFNIRPPLPADGEFLRVQDAYLREETARKGITGLASLKPIQKNLYVWRGDITTLAADAIVNAANSRLLGCFAPCHMCIDNAIHTYAGVQLRLCCQEIMARQAGGEAVGQAKITPGFNLPCRYVLHTVGPYVEGPVTPEDRRLLASCYRSCLSLAERQGLGSVAFCCVSTGEFHFPQEEAAGIAVETVKAFLRESHQEIQVIFNVFKPLDEAIYRRLLGAC